MFRTTNQLMYPKYRLERGDRGSSRQKSVRHIDASEARSQVTGDGRSRSVTSSQRTGGRLENRLADYTPTKPVQPTQVVQAKPPSRETPPNQRLDLAVNTDSYQLAEPKYFGERGANPRALGEGDSPTWKNPTFQSHILGNQDDLRLKVNPLTETQTGQVYDETMMQAGHTREELHRPFPESPIKINRVDRHPEDMARQWEESEHYECPSPMRKATNLPKDELKEQYYASPGKEHAEHGRDLMYRYRKDDQIFPNKVHYTPGKNQIVNKHEAERLYNEEHPVFRQVNDGRICYSSNMVDRTDANLYLAELRAKKRDDVKNSDLNEEKQHLLKLEELEDRQMRENERRRDVRKQVDDYHRVLGDEKGGPTARERAEAARDRIVAENEQWRADEEAFRKAEKQYQKGYGRALEKQMATREQRIDKGEMLNEQEDKGNTGLGIGNYMPPNREQWMNGLNKQMDEKNNRLNEWRKIDEYNGNWLAHKQSMDYWNWNYVHDHRRKVPKVDNNELLLQKNATIKENARKRNVEADQKRNDIGMINDLVSHERRVLQDEYLRRANMGQNLKSGLLNQIREKEDHHRSDGNSRGVGTSLPIGLLDKFGNDNYDLAQDIREDNKRRALQRAQAANEDAKIVDNLQR